MFKSFESITTFCSDLKGVGLTYASPWTAGLNTSQARQKALMGDLSFVPFAETWIDRLSDVILQDTPPKWQQRRSHTTGRVNWDDFRTGQPDFLRKRVRTRAEGPIRIVVDISTSGSLSAEQIKTRGVAILALVMIQQTRRPVELSILAVGDGNGKTNDPYKGTYAEIKLDSRPISLAHAGFAICHAAMDRALFMEWAKEHNNFYGGWPKGFQSVGYYQNIREMLGLAETDLYIKEAHSGDTILGNPEQWIREQLAPKTTTEE